MSSSSPDSHGECDVAQNAADNFDFAYIRKIEVCAHLSGSGSCDEAEVEAGKESGEVASWTLAVAERIGSGTDDSGPDRIRTAASEGHTRWVEAGLPYGGNCSVGNSGPYLGKTNDVEEQRTHC